MGDSAGLLGSSRNVLASSGAFNVSLACEAILPWHEDQDQGSRKDFESGHNIETRRDHSIATRGATAVDANRRLRSRPILGIPSA